MCTCLLELLTRELSKWIKSSRKSVANQWKINGKPHMCGAPALHRPHHSLLVSPSRLPDVLNRPRGCGLQYLLLESPPLQPQRVYAQSLRNLRGNFERWWKVPVKLLRHGPSKPSAKPTPGSACQPPPPGRPLSARSASGTRARTLGLDARAIGQHIGNRRQVAVWIACVLTVDSGCALF